MGRGRASPPGWNKPADPPAEWTFGPQEALHLLDRRAVSGPRLTLMDQHTPTPNAPSRGFAAPEEYLTITEVAARLKVTPKTVRNKMASGVFRKGVHYFSPPGIGPRFKWSAIVSWLEQAQTETPDEALDAIPMARGYQLGEVGKRDYNGSFGKGVSHEA
jgi:hypothetical protein